MKKVKAEVKAATVKQAKAVKAPEVEPDILEIAPEPAKKSKQLITVSDEEKEQMRILAHHSGIDSRKVLGQANNEEGVPCAAVLVVGADGAESEVFERIV